MDKSSFTLKSCRKKTEKLWKTRFEKNSRGNYWKTTTLWRSSKRQSKFFFLNSSEKKIKLLNEKGAKSDITATEKVIKDVNLNWDQNFDLLIHFSGYATGQPQLRKMQLCGFTCK